MSGIDPELVARLAARPLHLVIGGSLDRQWIGDSITPASELDGAAVKVVVLEPTRSRETYRVVRFRLGRAMHADVWIERRLTAEQAFERLLQTYGGKKP